ncbi:hypothetical protein [Streptococcus sobrinus]|uniref:hypothetical protein n=1 Tax=Streptococcus sobrinus TaxID=1310 RepID=UPI00031102DF|nr:hypothetical protein [Streptococcus sobrinus]
MNEDFNVFGIVKDTKTVSKMWMFLMRDFIIVAVTVTATVMFATSIFPPGMLIQMLLFIILVPSLAIYLLLPYNGGKRNYHAVWLTLRLRRHRFTALNPIEKKEEKPHAN